MSNKILKDLQKQAADLEAKGANKSTHENLTLQNLQTKIDLVKKAMGS